MLLNSPGLDFLPQEIVDVNTSQTFKAVQPGELSGSAPVYNVGLMKAATIQVFAPANLRGVLDSSNDLTITWERRTRSPIRETIDFIPLLEPSIQYEIDILDTPGGTVLRTITDLTTEIRIYTAAEQTADGFAPGTPIPVEVFQLSAVAGRGKAAKGTL